MISWRYKDWSRSLLHMEALVLQHRKAESAFLLGVEITQFVQHLKNELTAVVSDCIIEKRSRNVWGYGKQKGWNPSILLFCLLSQPSDPTQFLHSSNNSIPGLLALEHPGSTQTAHLYSHICGTAFQKWFHPTLLSKYAGQQWTNHLMPPPSLSPLINLT